MGIYGWSYGGYATAMCLCKAPNTFRVGVSGAPVTAWDGYDTHYTERYMGTPMENPKGYRYERGPRCYITRCCGFDLSQHRRRGLVALSPRVQPRRASPP